MLPRKSSESFNQNWTLELCSIFHYFLFWKAVRGEPRTKVTWPLNSRTGYSSFCLRAPELKVFSPSCIAWGAKIYKASSESLIGRMVIRLWCLWIISLEHYPYHVLGTFVTKVGSFPFLFNVGKKMGRELYPSSSLSGTIRVWGGYL